MILVTSRTAALRRRAVRGVGAGEREGVRGCCGEGRGMAQVFAREVVVQGRRSTSWGAGVVRVLRFAAW
ncbi:hypothetical protein CNX65_28325 [Actinosynnema pretiosum]|uniref:Uncharacterized protein n=1 Tax=Actinosynnema pretiosum TaxID=42197 RepID=A0A290ZCL2_9PSEU|nr:hypothetical protein CNX65_28325 [Actinosynnema pretiosum]